MKVFYNTRKKNLSQLALALLGLFAISDSFAQQSVGAHPNIDAGFESQTAGNLPSQSSAAPNTSTTLWAYSVSGNGQVRTVNATGGYGGPKYLSVGKSGATSNTSTTAVSNLVTTNTFAASIKYIVQFHYKINTGAIDTAASLVFLSGDNTSGSRASGNLYGLTTATTWTKFSRVIITGASQTTLGTVGIVAKQVGAADGINSGVIDVDNMVAYPADDQNNPVADITAPGAVTGFSAIAAPAAVNLSWTAPVGGADNGGYMIVRYTADPSTEPAPLQNAVYKATSSNTIGITGTVVYVGPDISFQDGSGIIGTNYWYRVYSVDKAFNYSAAATSGPVASTPKVNYYYDGTGSTDLLNNWWTNENGTGTNPPNFSNPGQVFHLLGNANLVSTLSITGSGSSLILGTNAGVNGFTVDFNSGTLPFIDTIYQSADGSPMVLNFNNPNVPSINVLSDIFTQVHYRAGGVPISVGTTKDYDSIYVENNADVTFNGGSSTTPPLKTNGFFVAAGSSATIGTLSSRWIQIKTGGRVVINGKIVTPKLAGLVSNGTSGFPNSSKGAIQFDDAGADIVLGPNSTVEFSSTSTTTTQNVDARTDYKNIIISGAGISKTIDTAIVMSGSLTMNTTGTTGLLLLAGPLNLNASLNLISGKINTDATNLLVLSASATVIGGNSLSYVSGPMNRSTASVSPCSFPVGKNGMFRPAVITPATSAASVYQAEFFRAPYSSLAFTSPLTGVDTTYWLISKLSGASATVGLSLDGGTAIPGATSADELVVAHYEGANWVNVSGNPINPGNAIVGTATSVLLSSFSPFTFGIKPTSIVPLTLLSFNGNIQNGNAKLQWATSEERNVSYFNVEESKDGLLFGQVGSVPAKNYAGTNYYNFTSPNKINNASYFRLKMVDIDGKFAYSNIIALRNQVKNSIALINNPVSERLVKLSLKDVASGIYSYQIFDMNGRLMQQNKIYHDRNSAVDRFMINAELSIGTYILKIAGNDVIYQTQFILQ